MRDQQARLSLSNRLNGHGPTERFFLFGLGDSVTAGLGSRRAHSYLERLVANPADDFADMQGRSMSRVLPNLVTRNLAVSGTNSLQHLQLIRDKVEKQPDVVFGIVVMTSGGNDLIHWYGRTPPREGAMNGATVQEAEPWIANYEKRLEEIFTLLKSRFPDGLRIFIADIYDPSDGQGDPESVLLPAWRDLLPIHAAYNEALRRAAATHSRVRVVPVYEEFLGHGIHCRKPWRAHFHFRGPHYWYAPNLEDPNNRGYDAIRRLFLKQILKEIRAIQRQE